MAKISIIVPVYNVKNYLTRCVDSILACDETDFELLLVDDGSVDGSAELCDEYAERDNRIKTYHKKNGGVSSARNLGLENASGEWVFFVDSDDSVDEFYLTIDCSDADIIEKSYVAISEKGEIIREKKREKSCFTDQESIYRFFVHKRNNELWNKAFKRTLIGESRFNENVSIGEDLLFYLDLLKRVRKYSFMEKGVYYYCERATSAMKSVNNEKRINILFENIINVKKLTNSSEYLSLQTGIIYTTYLPSIFSLRKKLNQQNKDKMESLFCELPIMKMQFISMKGKLKMLLFHFYYRTKQFFN